MPRFQMYAVANNEELSQIFWQGIQTGNEWSCAFQGLMPNQ